METRKHSACLKPRFNKYLTIPFSNRGGKIMKNFEYGITTGMGRKV
jgi:hypothetical protein